MLWLNPPHHNYYTIYKAIEMIIILVPLPENYSHLFHTFDISVLNAVKQILIK